MTGPLEASVPAPDRLEEEHILYRAHPAMFLNHPFGYIGAWVLVGCFGVGVLILLIWWLRTRALEVTVTSRRVLVRRGLLSRSTNEVLHLHIRNIQVRQSFMQRLCGVGWIGISSAGQSGIEIEADGLPRPDEIRMLIDRCRGLGPVAG